MPPFRHACLPAALRNSITAIYRFFSPYTASFRCRKCVFPEKPMARLMTAEMPEEGRSASGSYDLYIDIDGTLLRTDLLHEAAWRHVKTAPWRIFTLLRLALKGP